MIFNFLLKLKKKRLLNEVLQDLVFIETYRKKELNLDEQKVRDELSIEAQKENRDEEKIDMLSDVISKSKAVKAEHQKLRVLAGELAIYIDLIGKEPEDEYF